MPEGEIRGPDPQIGDGKRDTGADDQQNAARLLRLEEVEKSLRKGRLIVRHRHGRFRTSLKVSRAALHASAMHCGHAMVPWPGLHQQSQTAQSRAWPKWTLRILAAESLSPSNAA